MINALLSSSPCSGRNQVKKWLPGNVMGTGITGTERKIECESVKKASQKR